VRVCLFSGRGQRYDNGPEGAGRGAERYRVRGVGLRVQGETGRGPGAGDHVVLQQQSQSRLPVDTGPTAPGHRSAEKSHPAGLRRAHRRRAGHIPRAVHHQADHRADRKLQVRRVHVQRRGLYDQEDDRLR